MITGDRPSSPADIDTRIQAIDAAPAAVGSVEWLAELHWESQYRKGRDGIRPWNRLLPEMRESYVEQAAEWLGTVLAATPLLTADAALRVVTKPADGERVCPHEDCPRDPLPGAADCSQHEAWMS